MIVSSKAKGVGHMMFTNKRMRHYFVGMLLAMLMALCALPQTAMAAEMISLKPVTNLTSTNAQINARVNSAWARVTKVGFLVGKTTTTMREAGVENVSLVWSEVDAWYDMNKWYGTLEPNTTYYYQFYAHVNSKRHDSSVGSFKTKPAVEVTSIALSKPTATTFVGATLQLSGTISPSNATDKAVSWASSDGSVATVNSNGLVTGKKVGATTITVKTKNGKTATCKLTVSKATPAVVEFANTAVTVAENEAHAVAVKTTWQGAKMDLKVGLSVSDANLDIVNTRFNKATNELSALANGQVTTAFGGYSTSAPFANAKERNFYILSGVASTNLQIAGRPNKDKQTRTITLTIKPAANGEYTVGKNNKITITLRDVDALRPDDLAKMAGEKRTAAATSWLKAKYPKGKFWNHMIGTTNDDECVSSTMCDPRVHTNENWILSSSWPTVKPALKLTEAPRICNAFVDWQSAQCMGYANRVAKDVFGPNPRSGAGWYDVAASAKPRAGDYIRVTGHSVFVVAVNGNTITTTECNYGANNKCLIRWDVQYTWSAGQLTIGTAKTAIESIRRHN